MPAKLWWDYYGRHCRNKFSDIAAFWYDFISLLRYYLLIGISAYAAGQLRTASPPASPYLRSPAKEEMHWCQIAVEGYERLCRQWRALIAFIYTHGLSPFTFLLRRFAHALSAATPLSFITSERWCAISSLFAGATLSFAASYRWRISPRSRCSSIVLFLAMM